MTTATREFIDNENSPRKLDLQDPYDLAEFEHKMILACGPLHPGLGFLMQIPTPQLKLLVKDFSRQFQVEAPDEIHFEAWEILEARHGQGWLAICAHRYFETMEQCGMEFMTYIYALYRKGLPPGANPSLITKFKALFSESARTDLESQEAISARLHEVRDYTRAQILGDAVGREITSGGGLRIREDGLRDKFRQGV